MPTTIEELEDWMKAAKEAEGLEFKAARQGYDGGSLIDYCVGIGNEGGGKFVLGVTNELPREVCGTPAVNDPGKMQEKIFNTIHFDVRIEVVRHPQGRVVIVHIPSRPRGVPLHHDGRYLTRSGEVLRAMSSQRLQEIFNEGKPDWLSQVAREHCSDLDVVRLLDTRVYFDLAKLPYPTDRSGEIERLENERLIFPDSKGFSITNLGALLLAKELAQFQGLARKGPRVIVYNGLNKLKKTRLDVTGAKGYVTGFTGLIEFITAQIPSNEILGKAIRTEIKMFSGTSVRELVANALIHQDFNESGTSVTIEIYDDRIEIVNPGIPILSTERFIDDNQSRNERLAYLMRRLGVCEEQGRGIDRVIAHAEAYQLPAPDFRVSERRTTAVLFAHKSFQKMDRKERVRACFQHCVLRWLTNERMDNQSLRERFNLSERKTETASRIIRDAMSEGKIKPEDPQNTSKRYAKYIPSWA